LLLAVVWPSFILADNGFLLEEALLILATGEMP